MITFGNPGPLREALTALVLAGRKTATAALYEQEYRAEGEPLEYVGEELAVLDNDARPVAVIVVDAVETVPFAAVSLDFAVAEGEGFDTAQAWRDGHLSFSSEQGFALDDETMVVCLRFHLDLDIHVP